MTDSLFIPRSSIAAFAQSDEILAILHELKAHPLLTRAQYDAFPGKIDTITNKYPAGGTPELLILEHDGPMQELERLADISAETTQLIVLSRNNDISRYRRLLDQGGADYLFTPITPELLLESISRTFARAENRKVGKLITFFSCGGDSGNSTVAQNAAVVLSQLPEKRVMLLDFDLYTGTAALTFDLNPIRGLRDLLRDAKFISAKEISKIAHDRSASLQILCAIPALEPGFALKADHFVDVLDQARTLADYVVVDMPSGWSLLHSKLLAMTEHAVLVTAPSLGSFQTLNNIENLARKLRQNLPPGDVVINRWTPLAEKLLPMRLFQDSAKGGRVIRLEDLGAAAITAAEKAKAPAELEPRPEALAEFASYLAETAGVASKPKPVQTLPLIRRFLGKKGR